MLLCPVAYPSYFGAGEGCCGLRGGGGEMEEGWGWGEWGGGGGEAR